MHADVTRLDLRLRRRSLLGYTAGMALYALIIVALYPQFKDSVSLDQITKNGSAVAALFGATGSLTSPTGWLDTNIYVNFLPLIMLLITIGYGASCIAGQDEDGTLCLAAALPIPRHGILLQKTVTLAIQAILLGLATMVCVVIGRGFALNVSVGRLTGITAGTILLGIDFGLLAIALGCRTGRRGMAIGISATIAAASYLISSLAPAVAWIRPARYASLFFWSVGNGQLSTGLTGASTAVLAAVGIALLIASAVAFTHLDLQ